MHILGIAAEPRAGGHIQRADIPHHAAVREECVVDIGAGHVPVGLRGAYLHGQQGVGELLQLGVGGGQGVQVASVVRVDSLCGCGLR